ncbi:MAG TPA: LytTR family DNA-binding domain-containing protein [Gemmatimonadales bacterium]|nr:LytTR family DNA-binding domain-containing protein [Gemmatimonadales bacterium]
MAEAAPIRVLIADDEPLARARLRQLLDGPSPFVVVGEAGDGSSAVAAALQHQPDVIFLDIQMPDMNGFEALAALESAEGYRPGALVFVTAYDRYAVRAFDANAADYLLKPIEEARFLATLERLRRRLRPTGAAGAPPRAPSLSELSAVLPAERRYLARIVIPDRRRIFIVPVEEVECAMAADNYVRIVTAARSYLLRSPLGTLAERLDPAEFVRVHRSHVVAIRHVRTLHARPNGEYDLELASGRLVRASRAHRDAVAALLSRVGSPSGA